MHGVIAWSSKSITNWWRKSCALYRNRSSGTQENTGLPDQPDFDRIQAFVMEVNRRAIA